MKRKSLTFLIALTLALALWGSLPAQNVSAEITGIEITYYPLYIPVNADSSCTSDVGTPFTMRIRVSGTPGQNIILLTAIPGIPVASSTCTWSPTAEAWLSNRNLSWGNFPRATIGAGGTVDAWIFTKIIAGTPGLQIRATARPCTAGWSICFGTGSLDTQVVVTLMDMTSSGGWLEESGGERLGNTVVAIKDLLGNLVGLYRAENNSADEGYTYGSGGYKVAVPDCTTCNYTIETWHANDPGVPLGNVNVMGTTCSVNDIPAGTTVNLDPPQCGVPTAIRLVSFSATSHPGKTALLALLPLASSLVVYSLHRRRYLRSQAFYE